MPEALFVACLLEANETQQVTAGLQRGTQLMPPFAKLVLVLFRTLVIPDGELNLLPQGL